MAFVTELDPTGSSLVHSSYLGGSAAEIGCGIAVDAKGNMYVTGNTYSTDFPTVEPFQPASGGFIDAFVTRISPLKSSGLARRR